MATDYYVATNGNNSNSGTSVNSPFATVDRFFASANPGDTCWVRGGTYYGQSVYVYKSGSAGSPITIKNYPNEVPVFDGQVNGPLWFAYSDDGTYNVNHVSFIHHITFDGLIIRNYKQSGINLGANYNETDRTIRCDSITFRNCVVDYAGQNGITFANSNNILVENCLVSRTGWGLYSWSSGINFYNMSGSNNTVRNCVSFHHIDISGYHTDGNGFILDIYPPSMQDLPSGVRLENNLFFENGGVGVAITRASNVFMNNNTLYENGKDPSYIKPGLGIFFWRDDNIGPFRNITLQNNIIFQSSGRGWEQSTSFSGGTLANNRVSTYGNVDKPSFASESAYDFTLNSSDASVDGGTSSNVPSTAMVFDNRVIKQQTTGQPVSWATGQPVSWYHLAPDFDYIISKGGLANCITSTTRPKGGGYDQGAFENPNARGSSGGGTTPPGSVISNIYDESLASGWGDWSYGSTNTFNSTDRAHAGTKSLKAVFQSGGWATLSLRADSNVGVTATNKICTYVYSSGSPSSLTLFTGAADSGSLSSSKVVALTANAWTKVEVPFSQIGSPSSVKRVYFTAEGGTLYFDEVSIMSEGGGGTTTPPPSGTVKSTVYTEGLASGWDDWSYGVTNTLNSTDRAQAGSLSLKAVYQNTGWATVSLRSATAISVAPNDKLCAYLYTSGSPGSVTVFTQDSDSGTPSQQKVFNLTANAWTKIELPFSQIGSPSAVKRVSFGTSGGTVYFDSVTIMAP